MKHFLIPVVACILLSAWTLKAEKSETTGKIRTKKGMPITFTPTSYSELRTDIQLLRTKSSEIKAVEQGFHIDENIDGRPGLSRLEQCLYAVLVVRDDQKAVLDGIYYLERNRLLNSERHEYSQSLTKLIDSAEKIYRVSDDQIKAAIVQAYTDHLLETNPNAKKLIADLGQEKGKQYVMAIAQCWYNPCLECRNEVLRLAKELVPDRPPFPSATYSALQQLTHKPLNDGLLYQALLDVRTRWNNGQDPQTVELVNPSK